MDVYSPDRPNREILKDAPDLEHAVTQSSKPDETTKSSNGAMHEVDSFLNSIDIVPSDSFAEGINQTLVASPSDMHESDNMDIEDDSLRRRESQIWEGTFDNTPRTSSRKRKRAERRERGSVSGRSTESPSTDSVRSDNDIIPGALAFCFGPRNPTILTLAFDIDEEQAAAAARWNLHSTDSETWCATYLNAPQRRLNFFQLCYP